MELNYEKKITIESADFSNSEAQTSPRAARLEERHSTIEDPPVQKSVQAEPGWWLRPRKPTLEDEFQGFLDVLLYEPMGDYLEIFALYGEARRYDDTQTLRSLASEMRMAFRANPGAFHKDPKKLLRGRIAEHVKKAQNT